MQIKVKLFDMVNSIDSLSTSQGHVLDFIHVPFSAFPYNDNQGL